MSNYYSMQDAKVRIARELMSRGWEIFGFREDESDMMSDYWSPAHWYGIASKNGYVLVIDNNCDTKPEEVKKWNPAGNLSIDDREKISKLEQMTVVRGCTEGEEKNAKTLIEKIQSKTIDTPEYEVVGIIPGHMGNPGKCKWHIEKDGKIFDKGTGITKYADIPEAYEFDINKMEYKKSYNKVWTIMEERKPSEELKKVINDFKALILRFERVVNSMNGVGDGTEETNQEGIKQQQKAGYEEVTIKETKKRLKMVKVDRDYIKVGDYISTNSHGGYWKIESEYMQKGTWKNGTTEKKAFVYNQVGKKFQDLKNAKGYYNYEERMLKEFENGTLKIYELKEVEEEIEIKKWVKIDKSKNTYTPKTEKKEKETQPEQPKTELNTINIELTITEDVDTRDNTLLWVVKLVNKVGYEEFKRIEKEIMNPIKGYYSRFKKGFIFKYNPINILKPETVQEQTEAKTEQNDYNNIAETLLDVGTTLIDSLGITGKEALTNEKYKRGLEKYIKENNIDITEDIIYYLKKNEYNNLVTVLEEITSVYWMPEIEEGYLYNCHFGEWDIPIKEIQETITSLNIPWIDMGCKIGFEDITASQAIQVKEISDINGSILFIDSKTAITESEKSYTENSESDYNSNNIKLHAEEGIEETQEQEQETNIIDFEDYKNKSEVDNLENSYNSNDFSFQDVLSQFDDIKIDNNNRISKEDEEFCKEQEKPYKDFIEYSNNYINYIEQNSFNNELYTSYSLISSMKETQIIKKNSFISEIVSHFTSTYKVTLNSENIKKKYDITVDYNNIIDEIIEQLNGYNFKDKAVQEMKEELQNYIYGNKYITINKNKVTIDHFITPHYWNNTECKIDSYYNTKKFPRIMSNLNYFETGDQKVNIFDNLIKSLNKYQPTENILKVHKLDCKKIESIRFYKNGKFDIKFTSCQYAQQFAKEFCGYMEKAV